jgi:hypothetical protein
VFFRATSFTAAIGLLGGMVGLRGLTVGTLPPENLLLLEQVSQLMAPLTVIKLLVCFVIALGAPNTAELLAKYNPTLSRVRTSLPAAWQWKPNLAWGVSIGALAAISTLLMSGATEFLYFQF